jgi:predicted RNA-binding protein
MKFTAFGYFQDDEVYVEKMDEGEFHRRKVDCGTINREVNIKDYLDALEFIKDPKNWGVEVRNGMRMISKNDFELIKNLMLE